MPSLKEPMSLVSGPAAHRIPPGFIGNTEDRRLLLVALRYGRILAAWESLSLEYTLDIFPAALVFEPERVRSFSSLRSLGN
jgi:hypothetical protein